MTDYKKIFIDTAPFIYYLDQDERYKDSLEEFLHQILNSDTEIITSTVTCAEFLTSPYRHKDIEKENSFFEFISDCGITVYPLDLSIAKKAAGIRAEYESLKMMDSIQIATAEFCECDSFLTNDKRLKIKSMKIILVDDLSNKKYFARNN